MAPPRPNPGILDISPYVPGEGGTDTGGREIKLSSNETPLGPSPAAVRSYRAAAGTLARYPDGSATALREAIEEVHGLPADRIVCGAGSDELLSLLAQAYIGEGDEGILTEHGFLVYPIAIQTNGGTPVVAPERDFTADVDKVLSKVTKKPVSYFWRTPTTRPAPTCPAAK